MTFLSDSFDFLSRSKAEPCPALVGAAAAVSAATPAIVTATAQPAAAAEPVTPAGAPATAATPKLPTQRLEALETLTAAEADTLEAIAARIIPSDENGPGATEARAAHYIDRALTGPLRPWRNAYGAGQPPSTPMHRRPRAHHSSTFRRRTRTQCSPTWRRTS